MRVRAKCSLIVIIAASVSSANVAWADDWVTLDDTIAKVAVSESANADGSYTYQYGVTNLDPTRHLTAIEIGYDRPSGGLELTTFPSGYADNGDDVPLTATTSASPAGWSTPTISLGGEEPGGHSLVWAAADADHSITPGGAMAGYTVTVPSQDGSHLTSHWTVYFDSGLPASSLLTQARLPVYAINCGGGSIGSFGADAYYDGGVTAETSNAVDLSRVVDPAPAAVYQSVRGTGNVTYTFPNLIPATHYVIRLHFNEFLYATAGSRVFDVSINKVPVLQSFDIAAAYGANTAGIVEADAIATSDGLISVQLLSDHFDSAVCSGIEVLQGPARLPTPLQVRANGSESEIAVTWLNVGNALPLRIYRGVTSGGEALMTGLTEGSTSFVDTSPLPGQTYCYQTAVVGSDGAVGPLSNEACASRVGPAVPSAPGGLNATVSGNDVALSWQTVGGVVSFNVYRGTVHGAESVYQAGVTSPSFVDTGVASGSTYYYVVTAVNSAGEGPASQEAAVTVSCQPPLFTELWEGGAAAWRAAGSDPVALANDGTACGAFQRESTSFQGGRVFTQAGIAVNAGSQYCLSAWIRGTPGSSPFLGVQVSDINGNVTGAEHWLMGDAGTGTGYGDTVAPVTANSDWAWYAKAFSVDAGASAVVLKDENHAGGTADFDTIQLLLGSCAGPPSTLCGALATSCPAGGPPAPPSAPSGLGATGGEDQATLTWQAVGGATSYNVYRGTSSGTETLYQGGVTSPNFPDTGATGGSTYYYFVTAVNVAGEGPASSEVMVTVSCQLALFSETWEGGTAAWRAADGNPITLASDGTACGAFQRESTSFQGGRVFTQAGIAVNAGTQYCLGAWIRGTPGSSPFLGVQVSDISGNITGAEHWLIGDAGTGTGYGDTVTPVTADGNWAWYAKAFSVDAGATAIVLKNENHAGGTADFDTIQLVPGSCVGPPSTFCGAVAMSCSAGGPPSAPYSFNATGRNNQATLSWRAGGGATSYNLYRGNSPGAETLYQAGLTSPGFVDAGVTNGSTYYYVVTAVNAAGEGPPSSEVTVTVSCQLALFTELWEGGTAAWRAAGGGSIALTNDGSACGAFQRESTYFEGGRVFTQAGIAVNGGTQYCLAAWIRGTQGSSPFLGVQVSDISGNITGAEHWLIGDAGTATGYGDTVAPVTANGEWAWYAKAFSVDTGASAIVLKNENHAGGTADFDTIQLLPGSCAGPPSTLCAALATSCSAGGGP